MIKLGLVSAILPNFSFEEVIDYCKSIGLECVEICCWPEGKATRRYAGVTHINVNETDDSTLSSYIDYAHKKGVTISSLACYQNPLSYDKAEAKASQAHLHLLIDASAKMGINLVTTFIGKDKTLTVEQNLVQMREIWAPILRHAEEKNVLIGIENCPMFFTENEWPGGNNLASTPYIWREMFKMSPNIGLNYDPSHLLLQGIEVNKYLYEFKDRIFHVHFKDLRIDSAKLNEFGHFSLPSLWHSPKLPGLGEVNLPSFISTLNEIRYTGPACIEIEDRAFETSLSEVKAGIEQSCRYLRNFL
jgi:sugar phosphate isomerase/epimerase